MEHLLDEQAGVVARRQLLAAGLADHDIRRLVRRRELMTVHPGVFVDHTGELTWLQRAWAGVLYAWPSALCGESAMRAAEGPGRRQDRETVITVAVHHERKVRSQPQLWIERRRDLDDMVLWNLGPPRFRYEDAALDVSLEAATDLDAVAALAAACGSRRTTATRLEAALATRERARRRRWIGAVLHDIAEGTCSVLEHGYLVRVERPHGLPSGRRQARATASGGTIYRDLEIGDLVVELDGRLFHDSATARDRDLERDLDASVGRFSTVRLGWGQVFDRPCATAGKVGQVLRGHGWTGAVKACGPACTAAGNFSATG